MATSNQPLLHLPNPDYVTTSRSPETLPMPPTREQIPSRNIKSEESWRWPAMTQKETPMDQKQEIESVVHFTPIIGMETLTSSFTPPSLVAPDHEFSSQLPLYSRIEALPVRPTREQRPSWKRRCEDWVESVERALGRKSAVRKPQPKRVRFASGTRESSPLTAKEPTAHRPQNKRVREISGKRDPDFSTKERAATPLPRKAPNVKYVKRRKDGNSNDESRTSTRQQNTKILGSHRTSIRVPVEKGPIKSSSCPSRPRARSQDPEKTQFRFGNGNIADAQDKDSQPLLPGTVAPEWVQREILIDEDEDPDWLSQGLAQHIQESKEYYQQDEVPTAHPQWLGPGWYNYHHEDDPYFALGQHFAMPRVERVDVFSVTSDVVKS